MFWERKTLPSSFLLALGLRQSFRSSPFAKENIFKNLERRKQETESEETEMETEAYIR